MSALADRIVAASLYGKVLDGSLEDPQWHYVGRVHDWRGHVPELLRRVWSEMDDTARAAVFLCASMAADNEELD